MYIIQWLQYILVETKGIDFVFSERDGEFRFRFTKFPFKVTVAVIQTLRICLNKGFQALFIL
jgi:hypothetical protein